MFLFVAVWREIPEALQVRLKHRHQQFMPRLSFQDHERMPSPSAFNYTSVTPLAPKTASTDLTAFLHQPFPGGVRKRELWAQPGWHHCSWADVLIHPGSQGIRKQFCAACKDLENFSAHISGYPKDLWALFYSLRQESGLGSFCAADLSFLSGKEKSSSEFRCWHSEGMRKERDRMQDPLMWDCEGEVL